MQETEVDVVIIGGGIAGLWLHATLRRRGCRALLLEHRALGFGQTIHSQGIIHGGTKYTLGGRLTRASEKIAEMPNFWRSALRGGQKPDLSGARVLSEHQYLCSANDLGSRFAALAASKLLRGRVASLDLSTRPAFLEHTGFRGRVYQLDEPVIDVPGVLSALRAAAAPHSIIKIDSESGLEWLNDWNDPIARIRIDEPASGRIEIRARAAVLTAGLGNEMIKNLAPGGFIRTQRRPLHMVMARGRIDHPIYSHFLGMSSVPRATITTHVISGTEGTDGNEGNDRVLYIGGQAAEDGVGWSPIEQIRSTRRLLRELMPDFPVERMRWATCRIDRAEPLQPGARRPDSSFATRIGHLIAAWPTKLALAPQLTSEVLMLLEADPSLVRLRADHHFAPDMRVDGNDEHEHPAWLAPFLEWEAPGIAQPPWEECTEWIDVN